MKKVHHLVLLKFKPGTGEEVPSRFFQALARLKPLLPDMLHFAGGRYSSPEGLNQGFSHGFLMTFANPPARNHYLDHPEHERVKQEFLPHVEKVVAFDFEE